MLMQCLPIRCAPATLSAWGASLLISALPAHALQLTLENGFEPAGPEDEIGCKDNVAARIEDPVDGDVVIYAVCNGFTVERGAEAYLMTYDTWFALPRLFQAIEQVQVCDRDGDWGTVRLTEDDGSDVVLHYNCIYRMEFQ